ncbi:hypothetical protein [Maioricimonas rarisocia]|nr:hypothetical protein [Maioricimonas rarisocia]
MRARVCHSITLLLAVAGLMFSVGGTARSADDLPAPRRIYVPVEDLDAVLNRDRKGVLLPQDEFNDLYRQASEVLETRPNLPQTVVVSSGSYQATINGDRLELTGTVRFRQFVDDWCRVILPAGGLGVEQAELDGEPARIGRGKQHPNVLVLYSREEGEHTLEVTFSAPLVGVGSDRIADFELFNAPTGTLSFELPAGKFLVIDGLQLKRPADSDQSAEYEIAIGGRKRIQLRVTERQTQARGDVLTFASTAYGVRVAPGEVTWSATTQLQVYGQTLDRLVCTIPRELEITAVDSNGLESWELGDVEGDDERTSITLTYRQPFDGSRRIEFRGVVEPAADDVWYVPGLSYSNITAHTGSVLVTYPAGVRVQLEEIARARPTTAPGSDDGAGGRLRYEIWQDDFRLGFRTEAKQREVHAAMTNVLDINRGGLDLYASVNVETLFAPLFDVRLTLPAEWEITETVVAGQSVQWQLVPLEAGLHQVRIPLSTPLPVGQSVAVQLVAHRDLEDWPVEATPVRIALPEVRLPQADIVEALFGIVADSELNLLPIDIEGLDPARQSDLALLNNKLSAVGREVRLGYTYQDTVFSGQIEVSRKPTQVSARSVTHFRIGRETVFTHWESRVTISGGGRRDIEVSVPESAGTDLRFHVIASAPAGRGAGVRIVEQQPQDPANGRRIWTLRFDRRVLGTVRVAVDIRSARGDVATLSVPELTLPGVELESGFIAVEAAADQRLRFNALGSDGQPLREVDPVDFPRSSYQPQERVVAGFAYTRPGWQVAVATTRFDPDAVPTAVVHALSLESVLAEDGQFQHVADVTFTAVGVQAIRVRLPEPSRLWSTSLDGAPVEVRRGDDAYLIPLTPADDPTGQRRLELFYETAVPPLESPGELRQASPRFAVVGGDGTEQPIEILEQSWQLHHPPDLLLLHSEGQFRATDEPRPDSILWQIREALEAPSPRDIAVSAGVLVVAASVLFLLALGIARFGCLGSVVTSIVLGVILVALMMPATQRAREAADMALYDTEETATVAQPQAESSNAVDSPQQWAAPAGGEAPAEGMRFSGEAEGDDRGVIVQNGAMPAPVDQKAETRDRNANGAVDRAGRQQSFFESGLDEYGAVPQPAARPESRPAMAGEPLSDMSAPQLQTPERAPAAPGMGGAGGGFGGGGGLGGAMDGDVGGRAGAIADYADVDAEEEALGEAPIAAGFVGGFGAGRGALLSLTLKLDPPPDSVTREFRYFGAGTAAAEEALQLTVADERDGRMLTLAVAAATVVLFWLGGLVNLTRMVPLMVLVAGLPVALLTVVPASLLFVLDGLFLGGLASLILWTVVSVCRACASFGRRWSSHRTISTGILLATTLAASMVSGRAIGAEPAAPPATPDSLIGVPHVIVPYEAGTDPKTAERILVPHDLFLKLWNATHPEDRATGEAPEESLLSEALYSARLETAGDETRVAVSARYVVHNLTQESVRIPLPLGKVALEAAELDGEPAPLITEEETSSVVVSEPGRHVLDVTFSVPAEVTGPAGRFTLPLRAVPTGRLSFELPDVEDLVVRVNGGQSTYRLRTVDGDRVIETPVDQGGDLTVSWQPRATSGSAQGIVHVDSSTAARVTDAGLELTRSISINVRQGALADISFALDEGLGVKRIAGPDLGGWQIDDEGDARSLRVIFRREIDADTTLTIELYYPLTLTDEPAQLQFPQLVPQNVSRETGQIGVLASDRYVVRSGNVQGARQINVDQFRLPDGVTADGDKVRFAFRFAARPIEVPFTVSRSETETRVAVHHGVDVGLRKVRTTSRMFFEVRGAPRASLTVALPEGYLPVEVAADFLVDWYISEADGGRELTVEFDQPRSGGITILLDGHVPRDQGDDSVSIELPQPLDVARQSSRAGIWIDDTYATSITSTGDWQSIAPDELPVELLQLQSTAPRLAFRSSTLSPEPVQVDLSRTTPLLSADALTLIAVSDTAINYGLTLQWQIERAATDTLVFTTSEWLADRLDFSGPNIRQVRSDAPADGRIRWTLTTIEPVRGRYLVTAAATQPLPDDKLVRPLDVRFEQPADEAGSELEGQRQYAILVNLSAQRLTPVDVNAIETVRVEDLPIRLDNSLVQQAFDIVRVRPGQLPVWQMERFDTQQGAAATVTDAELLTVLAHDGSWRTRAIYTVRNRGRQFLALRVPEGMRILSVFVRGEPSRTVTTELDDETIHLVALPQTSVSDLSFPVTMMFSGQVAGGDLDRFRLRGRAVRLPAPTVVGARASESQTGSEEFGLPVVQTRWTVYLPEDLDAAPVREPGATNLTWHTDSDSWIDYEMRRLTQLKAEVSELTRIAKSERYSSRQRAQARSNLKQLGLAVHDYYDLGDRGRQASSQSREDFESFRKEVAEEAITNAGIVLDDATRSVNDFDSDADGLQVEDGRRYIVTQNSMIFDNNYGMTPRGESIGGDASGTFTFSGKGAALERAEKGKASELSSSLGRNSRSELRRQLEGQALFGNESQIRSGRELQLNGRDAFQRRFREREIEQLQESLSLQVQQQQQLEAEPFSLQQAGQMPAFGRDVSVAGTIVGDLQGLGGGGVPAPWTSAGGLSLEMELPQTGRELVFTKVGGDPVLTLSVRPRETVTIGLRSVWAILGVVVVVWLAISIGRAGAAGRVMQRIPILLIVVGGLGFLLLGELRPPALGLFLLGGLIAAIQYVIRTRTQRA